MCKTFCQLNYLPMLLLGVLAAVTLTYPGDWLTVAPDGEAVKRHLQMLKERWSREWGKPMALWKMEFQKRGAPHFHLLCPLMTRQHAADGRPFRQWLSETWAEVVAHPDPGEYARHVAAGTRIDVKEGLKCKDPKRVAIYFSKHGLFRSKEYQNQPPAEWVEAGKSCGRFWGVWGLEKAVEVAEVPREDAVRAARVLRGWSGRLVSYRDGWPVHCQVAAHDVSAPRIDTRTGVLRGRKVRRRVKRLRSGRGWVSVNDGAVFASQLARYLS